MTNNVKILIRVAQLAALALAFLLLLVPYVGTIKEYAFEFGNVSNGQTLDLTIIRDNFFGRMERMQSHNIECTRENVFIVLMVISIIVSLLACIDVNDKLPIFKNGFFAVPILAALAMFLWIIVDENDLGHVFDTDSYYYYMIHTSFSYTLLTFASVLVAVLLISAAVLKVIEAFACKKIPLCNAALDRDKSTGANAPAFLKIFSKKDLTNPYQGSIIGELSA